MKRTPLLAVTLAVALAAACGSDDDAAAGAGDPRTIEVEMVDVAFQPATLQVAAGETVRFVFTNSGEAVHEAYFGDAAAQEDHAEEMDDMEGMAHGDDATVVEPGETAEVTYTFDDAGSTQIGCHQPGHFESGMLVDVTVTEA